MNCVTSVGNCLQSAAVVRGGRIALLYLSRLFFLFCSSSRPDLQVVVVVVVVSAVLTVVKDQSAAIEEGVWVCHHAVVSARVKVITLK